MLYFDNHLYRKKYTRLDAGLRVPNAGTFVQIKHWWDLPHGGDNLDPYPEIIDKNCGLLTFDPNDKEYDYVEMPEVYQWLLWDVLRHGSQYRLPKGRIESFYRRKDNDRLFARATPGSLTYVYVDLVEAHRAFTEAGSPEGGFRDVVTCRNMDFGKNYQWLFRPTGGAMLKVVSVDGKYYVIEAIDILKPPPSVESIFARPWLYFWCTQANREGSSRFPQIKEANEIHGLPPAGTPAPLLSIGGTIKILKSSCVPLVNGAEWTPYATR